MNSIRLPNRLDWEAVRTLSERLAQSISADRLRPDLLVAVARGGWVPARLLSNDLGVKRLASIGVTYLDEARTQLTAYSFPEPIAEASSVLLVEDFLESGKSLDFAKGELEDRGAIVKTCCYYASTAAVVEPDYSLGRVDSIPLLPWD